jgi:hypothetical protein
LIDTSCMTVPRDEAIESEPFHNATASDRRQQGWPYGATLAAMIAVGLFLTGGLWNIGRYGIACDEPAGDYRGRYTAGIISRALGGHPAEMQQSAYRFHPSFYAYLNYEIKNFLIRHSIDPIAAGHVLNLLVASFGLVVIFLLGSRMFNRRIGLLAVLLLALIPVMVFSLLSFYLLYLAVASGRTVFWTYAGFAFGLSMATKLDALIVAPIIAYAYLAAWAIAPQRIKLRFFGPILFTLVSVATFYCLWPVLWGDPLFVFKSLNFFTGEFNSFTVAYLDHSYAVPQVPWHYTLVHVAVVMPVITLIFVMFGICLLLARISRRESIFEINLLGCWILFPLAPRLAGWVLQYDGMRHVFIIVPALAIIGAVGFDWCITRLAAAVKIPAMAPAAGSMVIVWLFVQCAQIHPYQGSYLNELVRAMVPRGKLGDYFDFWSWGAPMCDAVQWLNKNAHVDSTVCIAGAGIDPMLTWYPLRKDIVLGDSGADYVLTWQTKAPWDADPVFSVKCYGSRILSVYHKDGQSL